MNFGKLAETNVELEKEFHDLFVDIRNTLNRVNDIVLIKRKYLFLILTTMPVILFLFANLIFLVSETKDPQALSTTYWTLLNILSIIMVITIEWSCLIQFNRYPSFKIITKMLNRVAQDLDRITSDNADFETKKVIGKRLNTYLDFVRKNTRIS